MATTQIQTLSDLLPGFPVREETPTMHVRKRNGSLEPVDVNKIVRAVQRCSYGLSQVDAMRIASKTIGGLYDGATTRELDAMSIDTAASLIAEEPQYSQAGRAAAAGDHRQRSRRARICTPSRSPSTTAISRASSTRPPRSSSAPTPASSTTPSTISSPTALNTSACAPSTTAICCAIRSRAK